MIFICNLTSCCTYISVALFIRNIWFEPPQLVDQTEWQDHADTWRESLNDNLTYPDDNGKCDSTVESCGFVYFDGTTATPLADPSFLLNQVTLVLDFIESQFTPSQITRQLEIMHDDPTFSESDKGVVLSHLHSRQLL